MSLSLQIPESFSRKVFADGLAAIRDGSHPCHHMIRWQEAHGVAPFQLPEPFSGRRADYRLIFVGLNPSLSFNEEIPVATADWDCARYDAFYRARFDPAQRRYDGKIIAHLKDGATKVPRLWQKIESFGRRYIAESESEEFKLGQHAILLEIVHYKSTKGWLGDTSAEKRSVLEHECNFTRTLLDEVAPCVLVPMGNAAVQQLSQMLDLPSATRQPILKLMGTSFSQRTASGAPVFVTPMKHLSYPAKLELQQAAGHAICRSIEKIMAALAA